MDDRTDPDAGQPFPSEAEWLDLPVPPVADDFVERTLAALRRDAGEHESGEHEAASPEGAAPADPSPAEPTPEGASPADVAGHLLTPQVLAAYAAPQPSADFVARTLQRVQQDRRDRWREMLARHVAPEPSPHFVARTLAALATDKLAAAGSRRAARRWWLPLLAVAATVAAVVYLQRAPHPPLELRIADRVHPAFSHARAATPMSAVLASLAGAADPHALPVGGADGTFLLVHWNDARTARAPDRGSVR